MELRAIYRVTLFVPNENLRELVDGVKRVHPLGDDYYDSVLWYVSDAREEYRALPGANPTRGSTGELRQERVGMLVFSIPRDRALLDAVIEKGVRANHPWEAPGVFIEESWTLEHARPAASPL